MNRGRWVVLAGALAGLVWGSVTWLPGCAAGLADGPFRKRFASRPPGAAFEFAFGRPVPPDVSDLRATGETWIGGTNVWLRFQASEQTTRELVAGYERIPFDRNELASIRDVWGSVLQNYDPTDRIGWNELHGVDKPECFARSSAGGNSTSIWVDNRCRTVYVLVLGI